MFSRKSKKEVLKYKTGLKVMDIEDLSFNMFYANVTLDTTFKPNKRWSLI